MLNFFVTWMYEIVNLDDELLPPLPALTIYLPAHSHVIIIGSSVKKPGSRKQGESGLTDIKVSCREKLLRDQHELLQQFGMDMLPTMTQVSPLVC
jgi:E3 ubiquitin-protein ligase TRIP12